MPGMPSRTPSDFGAAFTALLNAAGLTVDTLLEALQEVDRGSVSRSTLYDWRRGDHLPEDREVLLAIVRLCLRRAAQRRSDLGRAPRDERGWASLLAEAKQTRDSLTAPGRMTGDGRLRRAGRPVREWDAVTLGVHKAIGGWALPSYMTRQHDALLRVVLDPGVARSRLVVLRGGSSTGKSRAAFEAVADRLADWPLQFPRTPAALSRLLEEGVSHRTVVWLDELEHYVEERGGADALASLAELLARDSQVVVITTLWPEYWAAYTAGRHGGPGFSDAVRVTRGLLTPLAELTGMDPLAVDPGRVP